MADLEARIFRHVVTPAGAHVLSPVDSHADEWLREVTLNTDATVTARTPRSPEHHRWFFAMLTLALEQIDTDDWQDIEEFLDAIKLAVGHTRQSVDIDGKLHFYPRSISFAAMGQEAFKRFVNRVLYVLQKKFNIDGEALIKETSRQQDYNPFGKKRK